jgi:hypothetical protein
MAASFAFEVGTVRMGSLTFEAIMADSKEALSDQSDKEIIDEALILNFFSIDGIAHIQKEVISTLYRILGDHLTNGRHSDDDVALAQIRETMTELARRYPQYTVPDRG